MARGFVYLAGGPIGSAAACWHGSCRSPWRPLSASRRWKKPFPEMKNRRFFKHRPRQASSPARPSSGGLKENGISISMDGRGRWRDNVFVERIWKSIKYEEVYLHAYASVNEARTSIARYLEFYNSIRRTQAESAHARSGILQPPARIYGSLKTKTRTSLKEKAKTVRTTGTTSVLAGFSAQLC